MKPTFEIHRVDDSLFDFPLENFTLTFDDGYDSQYQYLEKFLSVPTEKIYFVVPVWLNRPGWMTTEQVIEMSQHPNVEIGGHSFGHPLLKSLPTHQKISEIHRDTDQMCSWFIKYLGKIPKKFCFPYNNRIHGIYESVLKQYGFEEFYGDERIRPDQWIDDTWRQQHGFDQNS
jgi:peptidoglycan/xylan/chitin deacetylase (PgdA/CDA1 family)